MITIRLLGGAKKALGGKSSIELEKPRATISEILDFLRELSSQPHLLNSTNLIVAINGVDSAALQGHDTIVRNGDKVTVVTVVHGGSFALEDGTEAAIIGTKKISAGDVGEFLESIRKENRDLHIQGVCADSVYGLNHVMGVLAIVLEAKRRRHLIANKIETEVLLRLASTNQISEAISRVGLKTAEPGCLIAFSDQMGVVSHFNSSIGEAIMVDKSVLEASSRKKMHLSRRIGVSPEITDEDLLKYLVESAAILTK